MSGSPVGSQQMARVLEEVQRIASNLHQAGTFSASVLEAIVRHAAAVRIQHSVETGSGASTLLLSHLSDDHTVFAIDGGTGSIRGIERSPWLRRERVTFVEGPTQLTLPPYRFMNRLQLVLIDGPHAYPFPDLEYYYLYQHLDPGALLIVDDTHIPTVNNLFDFLSADDMFELQEVVENTAFFRRTEVPTFSPLGDGWELQGYNRRQFARVPAERYAGPRPELIAGAVPHYLDWLGPVADPSNAPSLRVPQGQLLAISGWALDPARRTGATAIDLVLDGVIYRAAVRVPRGDVADVHRDRGYMRSGFNTELPALAITAGPHDLELQVLVAGGRQYCGGKRFHFEAV